jgi:sulfoxide reductase heme-binding subunit YedZ
VTRAAVVTRVVKPLLYLAAVLPCAWIAFALATDRVDGDQVKFIQHTTGLTVLASLFATLSITSLRRLTGWNEVIRVRRLIGLTAFWYALLHFLTYVVFDQSLSVADITEDVAKHPWVLVGFASFLMLVPLAATSTNGWVANAGGGCTVWSTRRRSAACCTSSGWSRRTSGCRSISGWR